MHINQFQYTCVHLLVLALYIIQISFIPKPSLPSLIRLAHRLSLAAVTDSPTPHHLTFFASQKLYRVSAYIYQKDERALRGTVREVNVLFLSHL